MTKNKGNIVHHLWRREKCLVSKQEDEEQRRHRDPASAACTSEKKVRRKKDATGCNKSLIFTPQLHRSKGSVSRHVAPGETFLSTQ